MFDPPDWWVHTKLEYWFLWFAGAASTISCHQLWKYDNQRYCAYQAGWDDGFSLGHRDYNVYINVSGSRQKAYWG